MREMVRRKGCIEGRFCERGYVLRERERRLDWDGGMFGFGVSSKIPTFAYTRWVCVRLNYGV